MDVLNALQKVLNFGNCTSKHFTHNGMGKIGTTGFLLGLVGGVHFGIYCTLSLLSTNPVCSSNVSRASAIKTWALYMSLLCLFHFMEFFTTAVNQPGSLSYDSYIVNHSKAYTLAAIASWVEFWIEYMIWGPRKVWWLVSALGVVLVLLGQAVRSIGMWHCGEHFSHIIMQERRQDHQLVTTGIYQYLRHPSYFGWFYWSVGTQLVLCNPLCTVAYAWAAWSFFHDRIPYEEALLVEFYGLQYVNYAKNAVIGIPGIQGYVKSGHEVATGGEGSAAEASGGDGVQEDAKRK